jgi:hypothetical protein
MIDGSEPIGDHPFGHNASCNEPLLLTLRDERVLTPKHETEDSAQNKCTGRKDNPFGKKCIRSCIGRGHIQNLYVLLREILYQNPMHGMVGFFEKTPTC